MYIYRSEGDFAPQIRMTFLFSEGKCTLNKAHASLQHDCISTLRELGLISHNPKEASMGPGLTVDADLQFLLREVLKTLEGFE